MPICRIKSMPRWHTQLPPPCPGRPAGPPVNNITASCELYTPPQQVRRRTSVPPVNCIALHNPPRIEILSLLSAPPCLSSLVHNAFFSLDSSASHSCSTLWRLICEIEFKPTSLAASAHHSQCVTPTLLLKNDVDFSVCVLWESFLQLHIVVCTVCSNPYRRPSKGGLRSVKREPP